MNGRAWFSLAALLAGASLLISAAVGQASSAKFKRGGTLRVDLPFTDIDDVDSFVYQAIYESPPYNLLALK